MAITNAGAVLAATALINNGATFLNAANAYLGVGDSTSSFLATQTDLQAVTNVVRKPMDSTYPQQASNVLTFVATFGTSDGNFAWQEWGVFNAASSGTMFSRKVESLGTKTSAQSWRLTAAITVQAA